MMVVCGVLLVMDGYWVWNHLMVVVVVAVYVVLSFDLKIEFGFEVSRWQCA